MYKRMVFKGVYMRLSEIGIGQYAQVIGINGNDKTALRLIEMGFSSGTVIEVLYSAMGKNLTAYKVKNTVLALRTETADKIIVKLKSGDKNE